jgi:NADPH-dependent ferric siderophore reductase
VIAWAVGFAQGCAAGAVLCLLGVALATRRTRKEHVAQVARQVDKQVKQRTLMCSDDELPTVLRTLEALGHTFDVSLPGLHAEVDQYLRGQS